MELVRPRKRGGASVLSAYFLLHIDSLYIQVDKRYGDLTDTFGYAQAW